MIEEFDRILGRSERSIYEQTLGRALSRLQYLAEREDEFLDALCEGSRSSSSHRSLFRAPDGVVTRGPPGVVTIEQEVRLLRERAMLCINEVKLTDSCTHEHTVSSREWEFDFYTTVEHSQPIYLATRLTNHICRETSRKASTGHAC